MILVRFGARPTLAIAPLNGKTIVAADALHVGVGQIGTAVGANLHSRREVIHHRSALEGAGYEVVFQAEHVTHLVTGKQSQAIEHDLLFAGLRIEIIECTEHIQ